MKKLFFLSLAVLLSFNIAAQDDTKTVNPNARPDIPGSLLFQWGLNNLINKTANLDTRAWGSRSIKVQYLFDIPIKKTRFSFNPGIGVSIDRLRFGRTVGLDVEDGKTVVQIFADRSPDANLKLSTFNNVWIEAPIEFQFHSNASDHQQGFLAAVGFDIAYNVQSKMKYRYTLDGEKFTDKIKRDFNVNRLRTGAHIRVGFSDIQLFGAYYFNNFWKEGKAPEDINTKSWVVGLSLKFS